MQERVVWPLDAEACLEPARTVTGALTVVDVGPSPLSKRAGCPGAAHGRRSSHRIFPLAACSQSAHQPGQRHRSSLEHPERPPAATSLRHEEANPLGHIRPGQVERPAAGNEDAGDPILHAGDDAVSERTSPSS